MLIRLFTSALLASAATLAIAQTPHHFTRVYGTSDRDIPTPAHTTKALTDAVALQKIVDFVKMSGVASWKGLTADGTITYAGDPAAYPAHIAVLGIGHYRLDATRAEGKQSTVFNGSQGVFLSAKGTPSSVSSDISTLGLLAFPRLLSPEYPTPKSILTDQGAATIGGKPLNRITLDDPALDSNAMPWKTEDLYFDPATGRLVESVALVHLSTSDAALYMLETSYGDYRTVNGVTLPYTYTQSLNGQLSWTLSLTTLDSQVTPSPSVFAY